MPLELTAEYEHMIVHPSMPCKDVHMIKLVIKVKLINRDCARRETKGEKIKDEGVVMKDSAVTTHMWTYIVQTFEIILTMFSLLVSAKNRHNIKPFTRRLPKVYTSNKTLSAICSQRSCQDQHLISLFWRREE